MTEETFLLATDLSARSDRATDRAFVLAKQLSASLVVLHVVDADADPAELQQRASEALDSVAGLDGRRAEMVLRQGRVDEEILKLAEDRSAALIITGAARFNHVRDYFLGTAVDHLVRHSPVPVLVVKRRASRPYRRLLVATDFSEPARQALETAARLFPDAALTAWHNCHATYEAWLDQEETALELKREAEEEMAAFLSRADIGGRPVETAIDAGELHRSASEKVRKGDFDLLVLGTHGRGGFAHATIGSRAAELLQSADCDTLMVRGGDRE